jgi:L-ascorbate metabolism protein UlaG (beta-lactamase superfamily)
MLKKVLTFLLIIMTATILSYGQNTFEKDSFNFEGKNLSITFFGHASLMFEYDGKIIYFDPVSQFADYSKLPKADLIFITHAHSDHLDKAAIDNLTKKDTVIIATAEVKEKIPNAIAMKNGESLVKKDINFKAVPAYNTTEGRDKYHPKGTGNGYILTLGKKNVYVAGDTENTPEILALKDIEIAFLPMNQPYTMTPEQVAAVAKVMKPKVLYPYHFSDSDTNKLLDLLKDLKGVDIRIRKMK